MKQVTFCHCIFDQMATIYGLSRGNRLTETKFFMCNIAWIQLQWHCIPYCGLNSQRLIRLLNDNQDQIILISLINVMTNMFKTGECFQSKCSIPKHKLAKKYNLSFAYFSQQN